MVLSESLKERYAGAARLVALMHSLHRLFEVQPAPPMRRSDLAVLGALRYLEEQGAGPVNASRLARMMKQSPPGISQKLRELEAAGLIRRRQGRADRRVATIQLTEKGRKAADDNLAQMLERLEGTLGRLGEQDAGQLLALLERLSAAMEEAETPPPTTTEEEQAEC